MNEVKVIKISEIKDYEIKKIIDIAGFNTITKPRCVLLEDKNNTNANNSAELIFSSLYEAVRAIESYVDNQFKFVM